MPSSSGPVGARSFAGRRRQRRAAALAALVVGLALAAPVASWPAVAGAQGAPGAQAFSARITLPGADHCQLMTSPQLSTLSQTFACHTDETVSRAVVLPVNTSVAERHWLLRLIAFAPGRTAVIASREIVQEPAEPASDPIIEYASGATAAVGQPFTFTVFTTFADDAQCGLVSLSLEGQLPAGLSFSTPGCGYAEIVGTPAIDTNGAYPVDFVASDAGHSFSPVPFLLTVSSASEPEPSEALPATTLALPGGLTVPSSVSYGSTEVWDALGNRVLGDCVEAASEHLAQLYAAEAGRSYTPTLLSTLQLYAWASGGETGPGIGTYEGTDLAWWSAHPIGGQLATAVARLADPADEQDLTEALWLTGGLVADLDWAGYGPHAVVVTGASPLGVTVVTWGESELVPWSQWSAPGAVDDVFAVDSSLWQQVGHGPSGLAASQLTSLFTGGLPSS